MRVISSSLICMLVVLAGAAYSPASQASDEEDLSALLQRAAKGSPSQELMEKIAKALPEEPPGSGSYIVEGDLPISRNELPSYIASFTAPAVKKSGELVVNVLPGGALDFWPEGERNLTYVVDRSSFSDVEQADEITQRMADAAKAWEDACPECGVDFVELSETGAGPHFFQAVFVVRYVDSSGPLARAFFPSTAPSGRKVLIFPGFFSPSHGYDKTGILRHELGHVLGYRHEHIVNIPGCAKELNKPLWQPISAYTPDSIMHYFCGGGGSFDLAIREEDARGHRCLYTTGKRCPKEEEQLSAGN